MNNQNTIYVEYSQYTKLKEKYEKILKEKNEYKKILKEMSANLAYTKKTHDLIKNSVQAVQENFKTIMANNTINNNGTIGNTINAFSTSATNSFETLQPKLKVFLNNSNRKLEDIENAYNELVKSFNFLVVKYKKLKEEIKRISDILEDRGRILVRASGTEPLVRVMLEGENLEEIDATKLQLPVAKNCKWYI